MSTYKLMAQSIKNNNKAFGQALPLHFFANLFWL